MSSQVAVAAVAAARTGSSANIRSANRRPGLDGARATDLLWSLNHPTLYWNLVGERGWSSERFERWLALRRPPLG